MQQNMIDENQIREKAEALVSRAGGHQPDESSGLLTGTAVLYRKCSVICC